MALPMISLIGPSDIARQSLTLLLASGIVPIMTLKCNYFKHSGKG